jgi:hypothetical protein
LGHDEAEAIDEDSKTNDGQCSDEEKDLAECCVPEVNALEELAQEAKDHFDLVGYLQFKANLEAEEQHTFDEETGGDEGEDMMMM